ncbi:uncharacterized protein LACBIDRAFT_309688 [Laccaria bicolor S238N-H82]|uniref:Predicted protein n=1 Tax=Laccaria bicolor (strain S238N-H82 / ATCC MYA-4686) TaxID=486041 RepID=B0DSU6_LACBS|nr:uncharacterized protein LACBIDRAFT_309688 [Laccaria bicolor S238N-H82]EDR02377.1 predicted protein [Laccaria bicolor S238N-H82]|eukprot:XP_001887054.1 predicted protein [Laccaria bicolor S238N-H82]
MFKKPTKNTSTVAGTLNPWTITYLWMHRHPWKSVCCCMSNSTKTSKLHRKFQKAHR